MAIRSVELTSHIAVALGASGEVPTEFRIFGPGTTETTKGPVRFSARAGDSVMARMADLGRDALPFDYGHGQVSGAKSFESQRAAGWFVPQVRQSAKGPELWATDIKWTPTAKQALADGEFRYFSPAIMRDYESGEIRELTNIALTNLPATKNQQPLTGLSENNMDLETLLAAFGAKSPEEAAAKFAKLSQDTSTLLAAVTDLTGKYNAAQAQLEAVAAEKAKADKQALIAQLSQAGKLPPALHAWALDQSLEALTAFGAAAPAMVRTEHSAVAAKAAGTLATPAAAASVELTAEDIQAAKLMGLSLDSVKATKAILAQQASQWVARADGQVWEDSGR